MSDIVLRRSRVVFLDSVGDSQLEGKRHQLYVIPCDADKPGVEIRQVLLQFGGCISFRVHRNKENLWWVRFCLQGLFQGFVDLLQFKKCSGTNIGAIYETEKDQ